MLKSSMLIDIWQTIENIISGFFAIIPQVIYFIYASVASLLDVLQLVLRKLVGLDVYYVKDPSTGIVVEKSGDILKEFFEGIMGINNNYSSLSTVFWSLIIFGVIVLVLATIFSIIKAHYNYDDKKSNPMTIIKNSLKALATMAITPFVVLFGLYLSEVTLNALDSITRKDPATTISEVYEKEALPNIKSLTVDENTVYYAQYDMFSATEWTSGTTFSGLLFEIMATNANRVRLNDYSATKTISNSDWDNCGIFFANTDANRQEVVADQIDFAFINCLKLANPRTINLKDESISVIASTLVYGPSAAFSAGLINVQDFSKFNVGLVWHYYNLWSANYLLGFLGIFACFGLLFNIIFGLMKRLIICIALFLVNAPVIGLQPLDDGNAFKEWRKTFISYFISGYGAVVGMNLFFLILPVLQGISLFNISILDKIFNMLIIIAGLAMIKKLIAMLSAFVGGVDLNKEGEATKKAVGETASKALSATFATVKAGIKVGSFAMTGGAAGAAVKGIKHSRAASKMVKAGAAIDKKQALEFIREDEKARKEDRKIRIKRKLTDPLKNGSSKFMKAINSPLGKFFMSYTGLAPGPIFESERETVIDDTGAATTLSVEDTRVYRGQKRIKQAVSNITDVSGLIFKATGDLTGTTKAFDSLKSRGVVDEAKETAQTFFQAAGVDIKPMQGGSSPLSTAKQVEKSSDKATSRRYEDAAETALQSRLMANEIFELTEKLKRSP